MVLVRTRGQSITRLLALPLLLTALLAGCSEGQKLEPAQRPLYERLGGNKAIARVVDDFVANVVADPKLEKRHTDHFAKGDVAGLKKKLIEQLGQATGAPQKYTGKDMKDAPRGLGIADADFGALVPALQKALDDNKVGKKEQDELIGRLTPLRKDVVEK